MIIQFKLSRFVVLGLLCSWCNLVLSVSVMGYISKGCGEWVSSRKETFGPNQAAFEASVVAYLSGIATAKQVDFLRTTDWQSLTLWIDNYCSRNPLESLSNATDALAFELIKRNRTR